MPSVTITQEPPRLFAAAHPIVTAAEGIAGAALSLGAECENTRNPSFYLASIEKKAWIPRVVVVTQGEATVGVVYAKERKFAGVPTGLIYADATLDAMVVARPEDRERVFELAIRQLLNRRGFLGLRILVPPTGFENRAIERILASSRFDVRRAGVENHSVLELPSTYESFLEGLGYRTRRNCRYYRRRFETIGEYVPNVLFAEFESVARRMLEQSVVGAQTDRVERALRMLSVVDRPILAGLRTRNGEFLSIVGGWHEFDRAVVVFQMNNERQHPQCSLSLVARGYLIETLIAQGARKLLFWAGAGPPLDRYCYYLPTTRIHLDPPGLASRLLRAVAARSSTFLPRRLAGFASWIDPGAMSANGPEPLG